MRRLILALLVRAGKRPGPGRPHGPDRSRDGRPRHRGLRCARGRTDALMLLLAAMIAAIPGHATAAARFPSTADALGVRLTSHAAVSEDGHRIAIESEGTIRVVETREPYRTIATVKGDGAQWSPDGRRLAYFRGAGPDRQLYVWTCCATAAIASTSLKGGISPSPYNDFVAAAHLGLKWSPDGKSIAFFSRWMPDYDKLEYHQSNPRIFTEKSPWDLALYEGMLDLSAMESADDVMRRRYIHRYPRAGENALFILDLTSGGLRRLSSPGHSYAFASWSPDGGTIAAVRMDDRASAYQPHTQTSLSLFDIRAGAERNFPSAYPIIANPQWFGAGEILLFGKRRWLEGWKMAAFNQREEQWRELSAPQSLVPIDFRMKANKTILLETYDRFVPAIWRGEADGSFSRIDTHGLAGKIRGFTAFDTDRSGNLFLVADGPTFTGRVVLISSAGGQPRTIFDPNPQLADVQFGKQERVSWTNDEGDQVDGVIIYPPDYDPGRRYPVLVDVYPVPARDGFNLLTSRNSMPEMGQAEAALGYIVFRPGLRAPHTPEFFSRDAEYNEKARGVPGIEIMLDDLRSGLRLLDDRKLSDPDRVCIFGHSNGGWVANFIITSKIDIRCAVISEGTSDLLVDSLLWTAIPGGWLDNLVTPGSAPIDRSDEIRTLSPIHQMENVRVPVLLITGGKDWLSWTPQMIMEYNALRLRGKSVTLIRYAGEGHNLRDPANVLDALGRVHAFFAQHLGS